MWYTVRTAAALFIVMTLITGVIYPLVVTGASQLLFPYQANGNLIMREGRIAGSELVGQTFTNPGYFWGRPSATTLMPYNSAASTGSNLSPSNQEMKAAVRQRLAVLHAADPGNLLPVPVDLVTASGSGLDPHISPAAALYQAPRIARIRGLEASKVITLVKAHIQNRQLGILGEPVVNVLELNMALDVLK